MKLLTRVFALSTLAVCCWTANATAQTSDVFTSGGTTIHVDTFKASGAGVHPSIIFLYGADAMALFPWNYPSIGNWFASQGYNFYIVHYFDKTGSVLGTPVVSYNSFGAWIATVSDATTWVGSQAGADPNRIALMGFSLGSSLGISASSRDLRIKVMVDWYGAEATWYENSVKNTITHLPPTIILHGANDPISPVADAYALQSLLQSLQVPCFMKIYPNEAHAFNPTDQADALNLSLAFLKTYM